MTDMIDIDREAAWEVEGIRRSTERFRAAAASADPASLPSGMAILRRIAGPLTKLVEAAQESELDSMAYGGSADRAHCQFAFSSLKADQIAVLTICMAINHTIGTVTNGNRATCLLSQARAMAKAVKEQIDYEQWVADQKEANKIAQEEHQEDHVDLLSRLRHRHPNVDRSKWKRWVRIVQVAKTAKWGEKSEVVVGTRMIDMLLKAAPDLFIKASISTGDGHKKYVLQRTDLCRELMDNRDAQAEVSRPDLMPMLIKPLPWRYNDQGEAEGGYIVHKQPLVRSGMFGHTTALVRPVSDLDLGSLNDVQNTGWRINRWMLDVLIEAWGSGSTLAGLERVQRKILPPLIEKERWDELSSEERIVASKARCDAHGHNASADGREQAVWDVVTVATELQNKAAIYFPHSRCFRGRMHPMPSRGPQPQGSDLSKSLLMFADGMALGDDGLFWLCVRAANCAGKDKLPLEQRVEWAMENQANITASAQDPLGFTWWAEMDEPWGLLATCNELAMAWALDDPSTFVSHLPIPLDGSCNGIQHLAALGLDPVGAKATNLCAGLDRQDLYEEVAKVVRAQVEKDAALGLEAALSWHGRITRKVVKRAVMTTPYGVTDSGIRTQLIADGHVQVDDREKAGPAADYLRDCIVSALGETVRSARSIMAWVQTAVSRMAKAGMPFDFTTPTGSKVRQAYYEIKTSRIETLCGLLQICTELPDGVLNHRKMALASSPNLIHAWDASHLSLTVSQASTAGIHSYAMIHDSYGTHAAHTTKLGAILRASFVAIYKDTDWLRAVRDEMQTQAPHVELPDLPDRGDFDVSQVLEAEFFFS